MLVVEIDDVDAQTLQAALAGLRARIRPAVDAANGRDSRDRARCRTWWRARLFARASIARPTSSSLVCGPYMSAVSRKVMPSSMARWMVAIDSAVVASAVELRHAHAAQADGGNRKAAAEFASFHERTPGIWMALLYSVFWRGRPLGSISERADRDSGLKRTHREMLSARLKSITRDSMVTVVKSPILVSSMKSVLFRKHIWRKCEPIESDLRIPSGHWLWATCPVLSGEVRAQLATAISGLVFSRTSPISTAGTPAALEIADAGTEAPLRPQSAIPRRSGDRIYSVFKSSGIALFVSDHAFGKIPVVFQTAGDVAGSNAIQRTFEQGDLADAET